MYMCLSCSYGFAVVSMHPFLCLFTVCECVVVVVGEGGGVLPSTAGWSHIFMTGFIDYNWGYIFNRVTRMGLHSFGIWAVRIFW